MAILEHFWRIHSQGTLGVKEVVKQLLAPQLLILLSSFSQLSKDIVS